MKIETKIRFDSSKDMCDFLITNHDNYYNIKADTVNHQFIVVDTQEVTEPEFNMSNLSSIAHDNELTMEQQNAIDYAISAIKTLVDMEVIK